MKAYAMRQREGKPGGGKGPLLQVDVSGTLLDHSDQTIFQPVEDGEGNVQHVVRRLTPRECERLQAFPDDWTKIPWRGKPAEECPDGPRYKALGNSMTTTVMRWIGTRIQRVEDEIKKEEAMEETEEPMREVPVMRYKLLDEGIEEPRYAHEGDAGLDLRSTTDEVIVPSGRVTVGTGVAVEIPDGCVGLVFPRSGLACRRGLRLANCVGVIDSGYRGEVKATLVNDSKQDVAVRRGDRVCQMVVVPYVGVSLERADSLTETERGAGGYGSTGVE